MTKQVKVGGKLTEKERKSLPNSSYGLEDDRKYPMQKRVNGKLVDSRSHAGNAKSRAEVQEKRGNITQAEENTIDAKANRILRKGKKKKGSSKSSNVDNYVNSIR